MQGNHGTYIVHPSRLMPALAAMRAFAVNFLSVAVIEIATVESYSLEHPMAGDPSTI